MQNQENNNLSQTISIIVTSQSPDNIIRLLKSLIKSNNHQLNIILLLQDFDLGTSEEYLLSNFSKLTLKKIPKTSLSCARNLGSEIAQGETFIFLDDDIEIVQTIDLKKDSYNLSLCAFQIFRNDNGMELFVSKKASPKKILKPSQWRFFMGGALLVKRDIFLKLNGFNENLGIGTENGSGEETDLLFKALSNGYKVGYIKDKMFIHPPIDKVSIDKMISYASGQGYMSTLEGIFTKRFFYCFLRPAINHLISSIVPINSHSKVLNKLLLKALIIGAKKKW